MYRFQLDTSPNVDPEFLWVDMTVSTVPEDDAEFPTIVFEGPVRVVGPDPQDDATKQLRDVLVAAAELL